MNFLGTINQLINNDLELANLFERVKEYAELYLIAKQRQKGCDGMGEVSTLKDELVYLMNKIISYCQEKEYISEYITYDIDSISREIMNIKNENNY